MNQKQELKELYESVTGTILGGQVKEYVEARFDEYNAAHVENHLRTKVLIAYLQSDVDRNRTWLKQLKVEQHQWSGITLGHTEKMNKIQKNILTLGLVSVILALVLVTHLCVAYL